MIGDATTYTLWVYLDREIRIAVGALGRCTFPAGWYAYTGSARRGLRARLRRHCAPPAAKRMRWHVDYLLTSPHAAIRFMQLSGDPECAVNQRVAGTSPCPGFGASDCRGGCGSHLRYRGPAFDLQALAPSPSPGR
ncbi:MAG TPA: GIY-YIG nuclease family protein [Gammaproteobacteria bacterium]|nr:GIY-YIG nuclease family protein [Gammaproteobacteria bacterium]